MRRYQTGSTDVGAFEKGQNHAWVVDVAAKHTGDECLACVFDAGRSGYPRVIAKGKKRRVCRVLCEIMYGPPPSETHQAAHSCGNKWCVNPHHLRWATVKENHADKLLHGTIARGSRNGNAKLNEASVRAIKKMLGGGALLREVADEFDVSVTNVSDIKRGRIWSWV